MTPPPVPQSRRGPKPKSPLATKTNDVDTSKRIRNKNQTNDKKPTQGLVKGIGSSESNSIENERPKPPFLKLKRLNLDEYAHLIDNCPLHHSKRTQSLEIDDSTMKLNSVSELKETPLRRSNRTKDNGKINEKVSNEDQKKPNGLKRKRETTKHNKKLCEAINIELPNRLFMVNEVVLCTIPGYSPWPAIIKNINNQTIFVEFFGTGQV